MTDLLEFDSVELSFDQRKILSGIYMQCETGKVIGLLGRNGCGKSTLLKVVFGTQQADHKSIRINGVPIGPFVSKHIAYLPQDDLIPPYITIRKAFQLFGIGLSSICSDYPQIEEFLPFKPHELSGGYKRFVEVLLVLKSRAKFCLLDEPFSGLMPIHIERIIDLMAEAKKEKGIIITDHLYRHVASVADALYVLANGRTYPIKEKEQLITLGYVNSL